MLKALTLNWTWLASTKSIAGDMIAGGVEDHLPLTNHFVEVRAWVAEMATRAKHAVAAAA